MKWDPAKEQFLNDPDAERSLASAGDVASLITGSYNAFFVGYNSYSGPGMFMSNQAFIHNAPWLPNV